MLNKTQLARLSELTASLDNSFEHYAKLQQILLTELLVLYSFYHKKSLTQKDICDEWGLPKQTVHTICKNFLEQNYLQSFDNPNDKRAKLLALTQAGKTYSKNIITPLLTIENNTAQSFGIKRLENLIQEFGELAQIFNTKMNEFAK